MKKFKLHNSILFWLIFAFLSTSAILTFSTYWFLFSKTMRVIDIPGVENSFFNGFINQWNYDLDYTVFQPRHLINPFSQLVQIGGFFDTFWIFEFSIIMLCVIIILPIGLKNTWFSKPDEFYIKKIYSYNFLIIIFIICFCQFIIYFNFDFYQLMFEKTIYQNFNHKFLLDELGLEELNSQINIAVSGLKDILKFKTDALVLTTTIFMGFGIFLLAYADVFNLIFSKKIISKNAGNE
ncbi:hypothetical protein [Spiroplasma alleghenense]|uniref:Uncharacterized protein n=1 Tax=Spiroplasma alleghenense TaxID=216931 RepID=A0A345Z4P9_9MOLU|nr:hypothetical protein [Spiroplasma alleghenense]AXK51578.1 hypothetical protein SALLE_v1c09080 [Spiroplasma alleghenense]